MDRPTNGSDNTDGITGAHINSGAELFSGDISASSLVAHWRQLRAQQANAPSSGGMVLDVPAGELRFRGLPTRGQISNIEFEVPAPPPSFSELLIGASLVGSSEKTDEGQLIALITPLWRRILDELLRNPDLLLDRLLDPRQFEEFVAGAYDQKGWERVILTPRSGDRGRDIIAYRSEFGGIRVLEQVKLYAPSTIVKADDVRALWGVLNRDAGASKGVLTTTSRFEPGVYKEFADCMPTRLELRNGTQLRDWLKPLA